MDRNEIQIRTAYTRPLKEKIKIIQSKYSITKKTTDRISPAVNDTIIRIVSNVILAYAAAPFIGPYLASVALYTPQVRNAITDCIEYVNNTQLSLKLKETTSNILSGFITFVFDSDNKFNQMIIELRRDQSEESRRGFVQNFVRNRLETYLRDQEVLLPDFDLQAFLTPYIMYLDEINRKHIIEELSKFCVLIGGYTFPESQAVSIENQNDFLNKTINIFNICRRRNITTEVSIEAIMKLKKTTTKLKHIMVQIYLTIWFSKLEPAFQIYLYFYFDFNKMFGKSLDEYPNLKHHLKMNMFKSTKFFKLLFIKVDPNC